MIQDPAAKLEIRSHAATVNGNKRRARHPGYWIPLEVPDSFTQKIPQDRLNHSESLVTPRDEVGVSQSGADDSNNHCSSTLTGDHTPSDINNRSEAYSSVLQKCSWATDAVVISRPAQEMSKVHSMHATPEHRARRTSKPKVRSGCVTCKCVFSAPPTSFLFQSYLSQLLYDSKDFLILTMLNHLDPATSNATKQYRHASGA